jgi:hypothetical protein
MKRYLCLLSFLVILPALALPARYSVIPQARAENPSTGQNQAANGISTTTVAAYVTQQAKLYGIDPTKALWIVSHESQLGQNLYGDDGQSLGPWMISTIWHPEVGRACSLSLQCSTAWSLSWIKKNAGNIEQWSTWSCRFAWYPAATSTLGPAPAGYKEPQYCK